MSDTAAMPLARPTERGLIHILPFLCSALRLLLIRTVQSCWNGIAVLDPAPFYAPPHVRFRMAKLSDGECSASECGLICSTCYPICAGLPQ